MGINCEENILKRKEIQKECLIPGKSPSLVSEGISDSLFKSIARIEVNEGVNKKISTGFFIKLNINNHQLNIFQTCHHSITEEDIKSKLTIDIFFGKKLEEKTIKIKLDKDRRFIHSDNELDSTLMEILPEDKIPKDLYLFPDLNYFNGYEQYKDQQVYTAGYPNVLINKGEKHMSTGIIKEIESSCFYHTCDTRKGSSGSPIINNSKQIIGIHIGFDKELNMNIGSFIGQIINKIKFNKDDNKQNLINEIRNKDEEEESVISNLKNYDLDYEDPIPKKIENVPSNPGNSGMELMTPELISAVLKNPALIQMGANLYSNPELVKSLSQMPQIQNMMEQNPFMKIGIENPQLVQQIMTPQNIQFFNKFFQPKSPNEN